jgi:transposase
LTATGDPARFKTADSLVAYLGLNPNTRESGTSVRGKTRITKAGNSYARGVLFGCAVVAMRRHYKSGKALNPPCCALWERMVARNKGGRCGCVAVAAKLARTIWGVCKRGEPWSRENAR